MAVTGSTPWRELGDCSAAAWKALAASKGAPFELSSERAWEAAKPHSRLCAGKIVAESSFGTDYDLNEEANNNPLNLKTPDGSGWMKYPTLEAGIAGWRERITSPTYKSGVYHRTTTLADLVNVYAPASENDVEEYIRNVCAIANRLAPVGGSPMLELTFGRVPHPPYIRNIASKPDTRSGYGYDYVDRRRIKGLVHHETLGLMTPQGYRDFFSCPGGERCGNALVDYLIGKDGQIMMINDPRGHRAPWASGGGVDLPGGLEGDGIAFVSKFGADAINRDLVSIEYIKTGDQDFTEAQVQSGGALTAYWHDQDEQPWEPYPLVPKYGTVLDFLHFEFGTTSCGKNEHDDITKVQAVARGLMRKWQEGGDGSPETPDVPPLPAPELPGGISLALAKERFGFFTRHLPDGSQQVDRWGFDPHGLVSLAWAQRNAAKERPFEKWPESGDWYVLDETDDGMRLDVLTWKKSGDLLIRKSERGGFKWV